MNASVKLIPTGNDQWNISNGNPAFKKDSGAHVLTFDIVQNQTGKDITFGPDPMWVQMGSKPGATKPPVGADQGQIGAWKVLNNGHQLVVIDWNDAAGKLYYKLNFNNYGSTDPIIDNGGGVKPPPGRFQFADVATYALVALVALLVGMFVQRVFFTRRAG